MITLEGRTSPSNVKSFIAERTCGDYCHREDENMQFIDACSRVIIPSLMHDCLHISATLKSKPSDLSSFHTTKLGNIHSIPAQRSSGAFLLKIK